MKGAVGKSEDGPLTPCHALIKIKCQPSIDSMHDTERALTEEMPVTLLSA